MDFIYGSEFGFLDGYAIKPQKTFVVNTNAPLHTNGYEVPPSGGVAVFPDNQFYADRLIFWRTSGQKLYLEERSLLYTISDGALCIDFSRTPILPGTSITILDDLMVLSIVVPTASTIHRFHARLSAPKERDTFSFLARIKEDDLIRKYHTAHVLTSSGRPIRATSTHHSNRNTISYCTAEGQLIVVTLNGFNEEHEKHEEVVLGENGFLQRFIGSPGSNSRLFSDACIVKNSKNSINYRKSSGFLSDIVYSVTKDGIVQGWNVETKRHTTFSLDLKPHCSYYTPKNDEEKVEIDYRISAKNVQNEVLLAISAEICKNSNLSAIFVHLVKVTNKEMIHLEVFEKRAEENERDERFVDFGMLEVRRNQGEAGKNERAFEVTVLTRNLAMSKDYVLRRVSLTINWETQIVHKQFGWHEVQRFVSSSANRGDFAEKPESDSEPISKSSSSNPYNLSTDSSIESLSDVVFDTDLHSFDVVHRAVQIVTDNYRGSAIAHVRYGNWMDLAKLVETYILSVDFKMKFQTKSERSVRMKLDAPQEALVLAKKSFWWSLLRACEELDFAARGVISLAPVQMFEDVMLMFVMHKDRITVIGDNSLELFEILCQNDSESFSPGASLGLGDENLPNENVVGLIEEAAKIADQRIEAMNHERTRCANARNGTFSDEEEIFENGYDFEKDGRNLVVNPIFEVYFIRLARELIESANYDCSSLGGDPIRTRFGGTFTQSLIAANIRITVEKRIQFALILRSILSALDNHRSKKVYVGFGEIDQLRIELREIIRIYRELIEQLDLKIVKNGAKMSLCTWLTSDDKGMDMIAREGGVGYDITPEQKQIGLSYNAFIGIMTENAVRALLSTSEILILFRRLVNEKQYRILRDILHGYINETRELKPAINFYLGIAYSGTDHPGKALNSFQSVQQAFIDGNTALRRAVYYLLPRTFIVAPNEDPIEMLALSEFYLTVVRFLQDHGHSEEVVSVALMAIESSESTNEDSVQVISNTLFNHLTRQRQWFQAFKLVLRTSQEQETRRASIRELLILMLSQGEWEAIATMIYGVHERVVEDFLRDAASRQSPNEKQHLYELLYAFYVTRKDYRMAACAMYEYAKHIESSNQMTAELLKRRRDALAAVLNMQAVLSIQPEEDDVVYDDFEDTNLVFPAFPEELPEFATTSQKNPETRGRVLERIDESMGEEEEDGNVHKRQMNLEEIEEEDKENMQEDVQKEVEEKWDLRRRQQVLVLTEKQIRDEWVICASRVSLLSSELYDGIPPTNPQELFKSLIDTWHFDAAFDVARQFALDSQYLYYSLVREAIMIDSFGNELDVEMAATQAGGWVRLNRRHCLIMTTCDDHWAVVRGLIDAARRSWPEDSRPMRGATEAFLSYQLGIPYWLHDLFENHDSNEYLRCLLDFENIKIALRVVLDLVEKESQKVSNNGQRTWLPYQAIDEVMRKSGVLAKNDNEGEVLKLRKSADENLTNYFKKIEAFEKAHQMSLKISSKKF
ncbi:unnamed protein product [Caenorhabditis angaria]|uniref:NUP160 middle TPR domain-containing protein n=1 Tax=Caenorhabditis angaria TaxID=860376 RepID=A0A9P1I9D8_9PELO|nr:unnamed protein product [Caenorhabditis angaria]